MYPEQHSKSWLFAGLPTGEWLPRFRIPEKPDYPLPRRCRLGLELQLGGSDVSKRAHYLQGIT
jgi:hypothetical protein